MRRILIALVACLLIAGSAAAQDQSGTGIPGANAAPPGPQPKIEVIDPLYNFGTALEGTMVNHTFRIKNAGPGELLLRGIKPSCGCTAATPSTTHLASGESADIAVGFDTRFQKGHQTRTVTVLSNDPNSPSAVMTMQGTVRQQVAATPAQIAFGDVRKGTEETREVVIDDLTNAPGFNVGEVTHSSPAIKVSKEPRKDGKPGAMLTVSLLKTMPVGAFDDTIKVATNRVPIQIDVFGSVTGNLTLDPAQVSFGIVPKGQDVVRILKLTNTGPRDIKVSGFSSSSPSVVAQAEAVKPGKEYKITVVLKHGAPEGQLRGQLSIQTDDPEQAALDVPFYAIVGQFRP
ncbi:MAG TPA: DUF1573 domain-containing protein [Candidatus Binataceae bacterium]|nr:DUF1573 domain-containing protein [Candidatus Binataceae bacterium]